MVRRHGWQLPAHTFQVVAITVFLLLMLVFYVFLSPFLGSSTLEYVALVVYSPVAMAVFLLYFRSTAIDPSDPGVLEKRKQDIVDKNYANSGASPNANTNQAGFKSPLGLFTPARSSSVAHSDKDFENKASWTEEGRQKVGLYDAEFDRKSMAHGLGVVLCGWLVQDDKCRDDRLQQPPVPEEEALFCTLCNVEVRKLSKHCRNCDKCVDGFDHHCRWLNNCVGRKNYITFVVLMATSLLLLVLNWGTGIAVLVRCFVSKSSVERKILERLGSGFSRTPFAIVVALCTLVSLLASIPLGELFFFHLILIKKGITTYEYVMAMRAQSEVQGAPDGEEQSVPTSPSSSTATGLSGSSSLGLHYRGAWCTPPRVFVENQDEVVPHLAPGRVPSTVDPDVDDRSMKSNSRSQKNMVKISAWKLAKLDPNEATRAAAKARRSSSVLRPLKMQDSGIADTDYTSTMSSRSSVSTEIGHPTRRNGGQVMGNSPQGPQGLPFGRAGSKSEMDTRTQSSCSSPSRTSVNESGGMSPLPSLGRLTAPVPHRSTALDQRITQLPLSVGLPSVFSHAAPNQQLTSANVFDYNHLHRLSGAPVYDEYTGRSRVSQLNRNLRENKRTAVFWSEGAGRFGSLVARTNSSNLDENLPSSGPLSREQGVVDHQTALSRIRSHDNRPSQGPGFQRTQSPVFAPSSTRIETMFFH
ncbi:hypothetical protein GOP47_0009385 [Adiantum capillus-veneris]|uniref:S-acyltransferase n=1 Tax=Adiantum capillus-veneris TaxID=13818 RepID=A0A9D4ZH60_ADICA|nr:hypothetical protein GOP47_0009385 [Adiantum capillus-veneris]